MQRYFIHLAYNGKPFNGWQIQLDAPSVQQEIEQALSTVLREPINVVGCGRTDTGVHASTFYAHFETEKDFDADTLLFKVNCMVPFEIALFKIFPVSEDLHARFSATHRTYHYHIHQVKDPFKFNESWFMHQQLDEKAMNEACVHLMGKHDFTSFSKLHTQTKTNLCTISKAEWTVSDNKLMFEVTADRFLHNMVRAIVGTCVAIGRGKLDSAEMKNIINSKDRQKAGASVPAHGLYLADIGYPFN